MESNLEKWAEVFRTSEWVLENGGYRPKIKRWAYDVQPIDFDGDRFLARYGKGDRKQCTSEMLGRKLANSIRVRNGFVYFRTPFGWFRRKGRQFEMKTLLSTIHPDFACGMDIWYRVKNTLDCVLLEEGKSDEWDTMIHPEVRQMPHLPSPSRGPVRKTFGNPLNSRRAARAFGEEIVQNHRSTQYPLLVHALTEIPTILHFQHVAGSFVYDPVDAPREGVRILRQDEGVFDPVLLTAMKWMEKGLPYVRERRETDRVPYLVNSAYYGPKRVITYEQKMILQKMLGVINQTGMVPSYFELHHAVDGDYWVTFPIGTGFGDVPLSFLRHINGLLSTPWRPIPDDVNQKNWFDFPRYLFVPPWVTAPYLVWLIDYFLYESEGI
jgi:hypothetical protein